MFRSPYFPFHLPVASRISPIIDVAGPRRLSHLSVVSYYAFLMMSLVSDPAFVLGSLLTLDHSVAPIILPCSGAAHLVQNHLHVRVTSPVTNFYTPVSSRFICRCCGFVNTKLVYTGPMFAYCATRALHSSLLSRYI